MSCNGEHSGRVETSVGVISDRRIAARVKRKMVVRPAVMCCLEMMAVTKRQQFDLMCVSDQNGQDQKQIHKRDNFMLCSLETKLKKQG